MNASPFLFGTQYYRPPFPGRDQWREDLRRIRASGLNTIQLWVTWAWVEAEPGGYAFEDYDELLDLAREAGLGVVLSTVAELQPEWIHRLEPGATMIDHLGRSVRSCHRIESNQGLTPGGCTDHAGLWRRMENFLRATAEHFRAHPAVVAWDIWNELRWNIHATGYVCHCEATLTAFRAHLRTKYHDLDGLNRAWRRRYVEWQDVRPGCVPGHPYSEYLAFAEFLQERAQAHLRARADVFRRAQVPQPIVAHGPAPTFDQAGNPDVFQMPACRGNDFVHARSLDGYGVSHFPLWGKQDDVEFVVRVNASAAACGDRPLWISELQGGAANYGHEIALPVTGAQLRRWLWLSLAAGARNVLFWNWQDEVFGREATGFGLNGRDGRAGERLAEVKAFARLLSERTSTLASYRPDPAEIGVWLDLRNYHLEAAESGCARRTRDGVRGYLRACEKLHRAASIIDASQLDRLDSLQCLIMPCAPIIAPEAREKLRTFVERGGTLVLEADVDAWTPEGFYRTEPNAREFAASIDLISEGRRPASDKPVALSDSIQLRFAWFRTPLHDQPPWRVLARNARGEVMLAERTLGRGRIITCGGFPGLVYAQREDEGFERWVASWLPPVKDALVLQAPPHVRVCQGACHGGRLIFLVNSGDTAAAIELAREGEDLVGGERMPVRFDLEGGECRALRFA